MTTAVNDVDTAVEAIKLGASDYIVKPFDLDKVDTSIRTALEAKQAAKESAITLSTAANPKAKKETKETYRKAQMEAAEIINQAKKRGKKIGICGQAPSDFPEFAEFLVECGIDSMSLIPDTVIKTRLAVAEKEKELGIISG